MVVVVGNPSGRRAGRHVTAVGVGFAVARAIASSGVSAQLVGRVGDGPDGDKIVLSVAEAGVGHAALLRGAVPVVVSGSDQPGELDGSLEKIAGLASDGPTDSEGSLTGAGRQPDLDAEDLTLALRYLPDYRVVVVAQLLSPGALGAVVEAARWAEARLVVVSQEGDGSASLPDDATVFDAPEEDAEGAFATMVGRYAAELDRGTAPADAFAVASAEAGWAAASVD